MKKYGEKLIKDYIEGNDIEEYSIEELENDSEFMIMVINKTNDKNICNLCGDDVKKDPRFVKYLITKFNYDTNFIISINIYFMHNYNKFSLFFFIFI